MKRRRPKKLRPWCLRCRAGEAVAERELDAIRKEFAALKKEHAAALIQVAMRAYTLRGGLLPLMPDGRRGVD
jgi:hypothetical protein